LRGRGTETEESLAKRLDAAKAELEYSKIPKSHDIIIINDQPDKAFHKLEAFIKENWPSLKKK
jgi:guanylate kinase